MYIKYVIHSSLNLKNARFRSDLFNLIPSHHSSYYWLMRKICGFVHWSGWSIDRFCFLNSTLSWTKCHPEHVPLLQIIRSLLSSKNPRLDATFPVVGVVDLEPFSSMPSSFPTSTWPSPQIVTVLLSLTMALWLSRTLWCLRCPW